ncbi:glucosaminidase domain-containing protein [Vagococcus entomophilus]|uniref:Peptidoglycan hydrolase n=1 Tax=Vagococcus entomophilus TaxID=1160095 RepID=A0A430AK21_9ENTE|nr:glucosaminidase domain-containing protein [Vagococcus entomophilus]RSU08399.1 hypothetical protein CBF30_03935 [Vagococcus entomophilus]
MNKFKKRVHLGISSMLAFGCVTTGGISVQADTADIIEECSGKSVDLETSSLPVEDSSMDESTTESLDLEQEEPKEPTSNSTTQEEPKNQQQTEITTEFNNKNEPKETSNLVKKQTKNAKEEKKKEQVGKTPELLNEAEPKFDYKENINTSRFVKKIGQEARKIAKNYNLYASVMIAQAILESASGTSKLAQEPSFNLFGIKGSFQGKSILMMTSEDDGKGNLFSIKAAFRSYPSYKESMEDYAKVLTGGKSFQNTIYKGVWKSNTTSYKDATKYLTGRYATDTYYDKKINGLIKAYQLEEYDKENESVKSEQKRTVHIVALGETLESISMDYSVPIDELKRLNGLTSSLIYVGQELLIKEESQKLAQSPKNNEETVKQATYKIRASKKISNSYVDVTLSSSLMNIAKQTGASVKQLYRLNDVNKILTSGQTVRTTASLTSNFPS